MNTWRSLPLEQIQCKEHGCGDLATHAVTHKRGAEYGRYCKTHARWKTESLNKLEPAHPFMWDKDGGDICVKCGSAIHEHG
jgi:hypothetical protein